jgi:NAD(P)-dependent dehydrogenase (short-subunit alcohol dehydrogenase family)
MSGVVENFDLAGKRCIVFGADQPAGESIAAAYTEAGGNVAGLNTVPATEVSETVEAAITSLSGVDVLAWSCDLFLAKAFVDVEPGDIGEVMMGNFASAFAAAQAAVAAMLKQGEGGRIILVSHVLGERGLPNTTVYSAAHGAIHNFIRALAQEVAASGISVNGIALGWMDWMSDRLDQTDPDAGRAVRFTMSKRAGTADDVGPMATWLAGGGAGFVTGQIYPLDGGLTQHL